MIDSGIHFFPGTFIQWCVSVHSVRTSTQCPADGQHIARGKPRDNDTYPAYRTGSVTGIAVCRDVYKSGGTVMLIATKYVFVRLGMSTRLTDVSTSSCVHVSGKHSAHSFCIESTGIGIFWKSNLKTLSEVADSADILGCHFYFM